MAPSISPITSTYVVLGATGNTGSCLVRNLIEQSPRNKVKAYCRNKDKLYRIIPEALENKQIDVYEGSLQDPALMDLVLRDTKAVFLAVTSNDNIPGCRLNTDTATAVIRSLCRLREEAPPGAYKPPKLVLLSACCPDDHLSRNMSKLFRPIMLRAASQIYADLDRAEAVMRSHDHWIKSVFIKPAGLSMDVARGHTLTLDEEESFISYNDLSNAMIETAQDDEHVWVGKNVGVVNKVPGVGAKFPTGTPLLIASGFMRHLFPWLHPYLPSVSG